MLTAQTIPADTVIPSTDGTLLRAWSWARPNPRATLVVAHGIGEHGGCYRHVAEDLAPALDVDVLVPDFRGHGRSPGRRGVLRRYGDLVDDLRSALDWAERSHPGLPRYVLGHSNGGQVALRLVLEGSTLLAGLVLTNPALRLAVRVPSPQLFLGRCLRRVAPLVALRGEIPSVLLTRDPEIQKQQRLDPLRHGWINPPLYFGMVEGGAEILARAGEIRLPILVVLSGADPVIDPQASRSFFERLASTDKTLINYPPMLHEPLNEIDREQVIADIIRWFNARLRDSH
jgi:alpha-beta hydrolase superfamily lysophospholipase